MVRNLKEKFLQLINESVLAEFSFKYHNLEFATDYLQKYKL